MLLGTAFIRNCRETGGPSAVQNGVYFFSLTLVEKSFRNSVSDVSIYKT